MPISPIDGCSVEHWLEVQDIIKTVINELGWASNLVSDSDDVGVIQGRIIQNLYNYPIVVCDVSGKNPNVMFELGIRLAFDKPTVIIKDDQTDYAFDTSPIEHIEYPRDLRFSKINLFKERLKNKLLGTLKKSIDDPHYSPFLKHFGEFVVPKLDKTEVGFNDFVIASLNSIKDEVLTIKRGNNLKKDDTSKKSTSHDLTMKTKDEKDTFMSDYLNRMINEHNKKTKEDLKAIIEEFITSWMDLGYSNKEVFTCFEEAVSKINFENI